MKRTLHSRHLLWVIVMSFSATQMIGQVFRILHDFDGTEGSNPYCPMVFSGDTLFVAPSYGGAANKGTVFSIKTNGSAATNLHSFNGADGSGPAELVLVGSTIYGTAQGGLSQNGTIFRMNSDGSAFTNLHSFAAGTGSRPTMITNTDGAGPSGRLVLAGDTLFGVARSGGTFGNGVLFAIQTDGSGFTNLHSFSPDEANNPNSLSISGETLYVTSYAGTNGYGSILMIKRDGTELQQLHSFTRGADGAFPNDGSLLISDNVLFGTTISGGSNSSGTIFRINATGTGYAVLHSFGGTSKDGVPRGPLAVWNNTLYGTTDNTIFAVDTNGTSFTTLYTFTGTGGPDGKSPFGGLIRTGNRLYGTTYAGGSPPYANYGTIYSFDVLTSLSIVPYGPDLILAWPDHPTGFRLQSTANPVNPVWNDVTSERAIVNGQNVVIEPSASNPHFYRLKQ